MKLTVFPFVLAAVGLAAQVSAGPVRIYVLAPEHSDVSDANKALPAAPSFDGVVAHSGLRWGLAASEAPRPVAQPMFKMMGSFPHHSVDKEQQGRPMRSHHRCGGGMRMKALKISNWLREKVGLEPIVPHPKHMHLHHIPTRPHRPEGAPGDREAIRHFIHPVSNKQKGVEGTIEGSPRFHHFHHQHPHPHHHHGRPHSLAGRIQRALMTLGPWEGRLVAFVIGCGIGSLLRMFYVLTILSFRSFSPQRDEETEIEIIFAEAEEVPPPPMYVSDEKLAPADEKASA